MRQPRSSSPTTTQCETARPPAPGLVLRADRGRALPILRWGVAVMVGVSLAMAACAPGRRPRGPRPRPQPVAIDSAEQASDQVSPSSTRPRTAQDSADRPPVLRLEPNGTEEDRLEAAREAAENEDYDTALRLFKDLLRENPTLVDAYTGMGEALEEKGDLELAESAYARASKLDPQDFSAASGHGRVLEALGQLKQAIRAFQRALVIRPTDTAANLAMARLLMATGQPEGAIAFAERATRTEPDNGYAHLALARAYSKAGRGKDAIREYETATELIEPPADVMLALVNAYASEKRYQEAANAAEALTRTAPSAPAYERLGWSLFRLNDFAKSDEAYRKSIELDPEYWPALNGVGVNALNAWIQNGKDANDPLRAEARLMLQRSLRSNPDQPKVTALLMKYRL